AGILVKLEAEYGVDQNAGHHTDNRRIGAVAASIHYIHYMFVTLMVSIGTALLSNMLIFGRRASLTFGTSTAPVAS
ncbi:MAG: hypothetical protein AAFY37_15645, partial [Pseudomonadota bacterium]